MLGITNYEPKFYDNANTFIDVYHDQLLGIIGLTLNDYWFMWNSNYNEWYNDGPIILKIADRQFEFTAYNLDDFSLTINQIDMAEKLDWYGLGEELSLFWKSKSNLEINKLIGRKIKGVNIITYNFISTLVGDTSNLENTEKITETGFMMHGIEFEFEKIGWFDKNNFLQIFNSLDANGVSTKKLKNDNQFQKISINRRSSRL